MRKILAICLKQLADTWRNKSVLLQFVLLPVLACVMAWLMPEEELAGQALVPMFTTMYMGMVPLSCMTAIIAEEREKGTLRSLRMANVSGGQYLLGVGSCLFLESLFGVTVLALLGGYAGATLARYYLIAVMGVLVSLMLGAVVGLLAKNQMSATSLSAPVAVVTSFVPTLAVMNEDIGKVARVLYTKQLQDMLTHLDDGPFTMERVGVTLADLTVFCLVFVLIYRKRGLQDQ